MNFCKLNKRKPCLYLRNKQAMMHKPSTRRASFCSAEVMDIENQLISICVYQIRPISYVRTQLCDKLEEKRDTLSDAPPLPILFIKLLLKTINSREENPSPTAPSNPRVIKNLSTASACMKIERTGTFFFFLISILLLLSALLLILTLLLLQLLICLLMGQMLIWANREAGTI